MHVAWIFWLTITSSYISHFFFISFFTDCHIRLYSTWTISQISARAYMTWQHSDWHTANVSHDNQLNCFCAKREFYLAVCGKEKFWTIFSIRIKSLYRRYCFTCGPAPFFSCFPLSGIFVAITRSLFSNRTSCMLHPTCWKL